MTLSHVRPLIQPTSYTLADSLLIKVVSVPSRSDPWLLRYSSGTETMSAAFPSFRNFGCSMLNQRGYVPFSRARHALGRDRTESKLGTDHHLVTVNVVCKFRPAGSHRLARGRVSAKQGCAHAHVPCHPESDLCSGERCVTPIHIPNLNEIGEAVPEI